MMKTDVHDVDHSWVVSAQLLLNLTFYTVI
jgi:hypothetical protein